MFLIDTDHVVILQRQTQPGFGRLTTRMAAYLNADSCVSIIGFHEQLLGWHTYLVRAKASHGVVRAFKMLNETLADYQRWPVLDFDSLAATAYDVLVAQRIRISTADLRIAAIALVHDLTVLTRNVSDFRQVPNLRIEDWTT